MGLADPAALSNSRLSRGRLPATAKSGRAPQPRHELRAAAPQPAEDCTPSLPTGYMPPGLLEASDCLGIAFPPHQPLAATHPVGIAELWLSIVAIGGNRALSVPEITIEALVLGCRVR